MPSRSASNRFRRAVPETAQPERVIIYGIHAVAAALGNPARPVRALLLTDNAEHRLRAVLEERRLVWERVIPRELDRRLGADTVHQGALLETEPLPEPDAAELAGRATAGGCPVLVLDQVTDPHNAGAILRSAAAFGAAGLLMTRRHSPPLAGALAKSASGALEAVPVARVPNLARGLEELKAAGVRCLGLDGAADALLENEALAGPVAFVLGAEDKGLRQHTREVCDQLCRIAAEGGAASLNVSIAAAIALHLAAMARRRAGPSKK